MLSVADNVCLLPDFTAGTNEEEEVQNDIGPRNDDNCEGSHNCIFCNIVQTSLETLECGQGDGLLVILN